MVFRVEYGSGSDGTVSWGSNTAGLVYLNGKCNTDFSDLRFCDASANVLDYWFEQKTDSSFCIVWVEIPSLAASPATTEIYLYYGKVTASYIGSGSNTFIFFDDFSGNLSKWTAGGTPTIISGEVQLNPGENIYTLGSYSNLGVKMEAKWRSVGTIPTLGYQMIIWDRSASTPIRLVWFNHASRHRYYFPTATIGLGTYYATIGSYRMEDYYYSGGASWYMTGTVTDGGSPTGAVTSTNAPFGIVGAYNNCDDYIDWIFLRKHTIHELTHTSWGSEEEGNFAFPRYFDLATSSIEAGTQTTFSSFWDVYSDSAEEELSGYIFSIDTGAGYSNESWISFSSGNNTWANYTQWLVYDLGTEISWFIYANSSLNTWNITDPEVFTVQATVTYLYNTGGIIKMNNTDIVNGTQTVFTEISQLEMEFLCASGYGYYNISWNLSPGYSEANPYNFTVVNQTSLYCQFAAIGSGGGEPVDPGEPGEVIAVVVAAVTSLLTGFIVIVIFRARNKKDE